MAKEFVRAITACAFIAVMTLQAGGAQMELSSPVFKDGQPIPRKYSCKGENISPVLKVTGVPPGAKSLALIVDDPDAPSGTFVHWVAYNIPSSAAEIVEGSNPGERGVNSARVEGYMGPCPPSGTHRYFFKIYALDIFLRIDRGPADKPAVEKAMQGHILGSAQLVGTFSH
jgi:Raf kinase inhibitor-like YbhB/YbcL family protein